MYKKAIHKKDSEAVSYVYTCAIRVPHTVASGSTTCHTTRWRAVPSSTSNAMS